AMNRTLKFQLVVYGFVLFAAVALWVPYIGRAWTNWREAKRQQNNLALLYTTDTRGFLESCG
ncbi:MAG: hypothetical protein QHJ73_11055, partial [Armatimonadota bacterium]|nr:hypothetical protein [Armatimonadota bacterium]